MLIVPKNQDGRYEGLGNVVSRNSHEEDADTPNVVDN